ncbi:MAG: hypothetical protein ITG02_10915 [Patulibacter sp.]|nr:hypothetical protein [Patulibacter sp.]
MALDPALERPHTSEDPAFSDAVTCVFADQRSGVQGTIRLGLADGAASGLMMIFVDGVPAVTTAEGGVAVDGAPESYGELRVAGIEHAVVTPHERWTVSAAADAGELELRFDAAGPPFRLDPSHETARWGGLEGYEQPCRVTGHVTVDGPGGSRRIAIDGLGQRGHQWGAPDWSRLTVTRTITGWFDGDVAFNVSAMRPDGVESHADEVSWASVSRVPRPELDAGEDEDEDDARVVAGGPDGDADPEAVSTPDPRISTTMDESGRQIDATIELWESDEGPVWTATGEAIAGTTLALGRLRLDMAFFRWRMNGREGVGRYDILQRQLEG